MTLDILIVDDEEDIRTLVADTLKDEGYDTREAGTSDAALTAIGERIPAAVILDIWLQGSELDGLGVLELIKDRHPHVPVIMISGHGNIQTAVNSIKIGAYDYIEKPFKEERLLLVVRRAIENARLQRENQELRARGAWETEVIGNSPAINHVRSAISKVAPTNSRILISGPPGSGKNVIARALHARSSREKGPFITFNPTGMTSERIETELFGEERGDTIFTGALEHAHRGTLFVEEIADMSKEAQASFLRALQEQKFIRVGGVRPIMVDVRIMAATSRDLQEEMRAGRFREDLYYRLNVVPLAVPSLHERREDIPLFCDYFLKRSAQMLGLPARKLAADTIATLQAYSWPGNVRQLRNLMEWLLIMVPETGNQPIRSSILPQELFKETPSTLKMDGLNADIMALPLREAREMFERQYLKSQIGRFGGNISRTSAFIGMERSALHRKLKALGLQNEEKVTEAA